MTGKVTLRGHIVVPQDELDAVKAALEIHVDLTRREAGNIVFEVNQRSDDPCVFDVYEEFVDKAAFDAHQARVKASDWGNATINVERHYTITQPE
ncbi:putative quinol monooxygenase [Aestuariispira ectoiniformans]|uniref:putative quinol monooxygenase n=1 Tax=Aestuariispira ectoiniformans TaxID=2775080 RepID=UPI00223B79EE|nr:antibiotic biosynthesis monooxygenase [Aestuariispira ectoiniformans]